MLLIFLAQTKTPTTFGLQAFFKQTNTFFLVLSVAWSLQTCISLHVKSLALEKPVFPTKTKLVAALWTSAATIKRMMVLVLYFAPSFGLFDLLFQWKFEQVPFSIRKNRNVSKEDLIFLQNMSPIPWSEVDRWNYGDQSKPTPPSYTLYTCYSIGDYFNFLWVILFLHMLTNIVIKVISSKRFYKEATPFQKIIHGLEILNLPMLWKDWDDGACSVIEHRQRFKAANKEMFATMTVSFIFNSIMLLPLIFTGRPIFVQHIN